jgi:hypothetical protein
MSPAQGLAGYFEIVRALPATGGPPNQMTITHDPTDPIIIILGGGDPN